MNKKIKVIELLNIVARGKDIPKKIKVYLRKDGEQMPDYYIFNDYGFYENSKEESFVEDWLNNTMKLNEEVEILEDEEEIDIQGIEEITYKSEPIKLGTTKRMCNNANDYMDAICISLDMCGMKINKLVEAVKQLDKKINKED